jgi:hypothetical protein
VASIEGIEELATKEWAEGLSGLTGAQIRKGLGNLEGEWPPSLPEFRKACRGNGLNEYGLTYIPEMYRVKETRKERLLSSDDREARRKVDAKRIKKIRESLG